MDKQEILDTEREKMLRIVVRQLSEKFNIFVGSCMDENGNPKAPVYKELMKARGYLPATCEYSLTHK
jgi:hypothetical protein